MNIIPQPQSVKVSKETHNAGDNIRLITKADDVPQSALELMKDKNDAYYLRLDKNEGVIYSESERGLFYGQKTLKQILENHYPVPCCEIVDWCDIEKRVMYYDLRQTFPKFELLIKYIRQMAEFKANALIVEYEDKFPFEKYPFLCHNEFGFSPAQLEEIKKTAAENFIEIIPLQQSFGHVEYVLKHEKFKELKETPEDLGEMCPCKEGSLSLAKELISEIIEKHEKSEYIHLGCDEVWSLGKCELCKARGISHERLFIEYVNELIDFVCKKGKKPIIWHDMLSKCSDEDLCLLDNRVTVMIWLYSGRTIEKDVARLTHRLRKLGILVAGGNSVRCHDRMSAQNRPKIEARISNINQWARAAKEQNLSIMTSTNWATEFAMGAPYGIYETSLYPLYYSCEKSWNSSSDSSTFLKRFLSVFHGVKDSSIEEELENSLVEDYYTLLPQILDKVEKNKDIAKHMQIISEFENAQRAMNAANVYIYRYEMFKGSEGDLISLLARTKKYTEGLRKIKAELRTSLEKFLPEKMADMHIGARYFAEEFLYENFYVKMFDDIQKKLK